MSARVYRVCPPEVSTAAGSGGEGWLARRADARIGAEQRQRPLAAEIAPQRLEREGRVVVSLRPQQRDHLAERADLAVAASGVVDHRSDHRGEPVGIGPAIDHETRQRGRRIQSDVRARRARGLDVQAFTKQATVCLALSHDGLWVFGCLHEIYGRHRGVALY